MSLSRLRKAPGRWLESLSKWRRRGRWVATNPVSNNVNSTKGHSSSEKWSNVVHEKCIFFIFWTFVNIIPTQFIFLRRILWRRIFKCWNIKLNMEFFRKSIFRFLFYLICITFYCYKIMKNVINWKNISFRSWDWLFFSICHVFKCASRKDIIFKKWKIYTFPAQHSTTFHWMNGL